MDSVPLRRVVVRVPGRHRMAAAEGSRSRDLLQRDLVPPPGALLDVARPRTTRCSSSRGHRAVGPSGVANSVWRRPQRGRPRIDESEGDDMMGRLVELLWRSTSLQIACQQSLLPRQRFREEPGAVNETIRALEGLNHADHPCHCPQLA